MSDSGLSIEQAEARRRELEEKGLGDFAILIAKAERQERPVRKERSEEASASPRGGAKLTDADLAEFEAQFLKPGAEFSDEPEQPQRRSRTSFADAFRIVEPRESGEADFGSRRNFSFSMDGAPADGADAREWPERPRPDGSAGFDLGVYYDQIGLAREEAAALTRILARDFGANDAARSAADEIERLEWLLAALDIKPLDAPVEVEAPLIRIEETAEARRLRDTISPLDGEAAFEDESICAVSEERLAVLLDRTLTSRLAEQAAIHGETLDAYVLALLAKGARALAVPAEASVAGEAAIEAA